jgi:hypothetical protein
VEPTAALAELRNLVTDLRRDGFDLDLAELALERWDALDQWLSTGGVLPVQWQQHRD